MNKRFYKLAISVGALTAIAVPTAALLACGSSAAAAPEAVTVSRVAPSAYEYKGEKMTSHKLLAVLAPPSGGSFGDASLDLAAAANEAAFGNFSARVAGDQPAQNQALASASADYDAFVLNPTSGSGFASEIASLAVSQPNAPVVAYGRFLSANSPNYNWYVDFGTLDVGWSQGVSIVKSFYGSNFTGSTPGGEIASWIMAHPLASPSGVMALAGDPDDPRASDFFKGATEMLGIVSSIDDNFKYLGSWQFKDVAQSKWSDSAGEAYLTTAISKLTAAEKTSLKAIVVPDDGMAKAAAKAVVSAGLDLKSIWITGFGASDDAIRGIASDGAQDMTAFYADWELSRAATALVVQLLAKPNSSLDDVKTALAKTYPALPMFAVNINSYSVNDGKTSKVINAVLLPPVLVTSTNYGSYFKIS